MSLRDLVLLDAKVALPGGGLLTVHGLTLNEVAVLMKDHLDVLDLLFTGAVSLTDLLADFPEFCAKIISMGHSGVAEYEEDMDTARKLPFGVQLLAMEAIWDLSVPSGEVLGKLLGRLESLPSHLQRLGTQSHAKEAESGEMNSQRQSHS